MCSVQFRHPIIFSLQTKHSHRKVLLIIYETNVETGIFEDIFIVIDRVLITTFTFFMDIPSQIFWCYTFTGILYTAILAGKKVNMVPNFTMNVYGRVSSSC